MGQIVVGVDASAGSRADLRSAASTAAGGDALRVVTAWQYPARTGALMGPTELPTVAEVVRAAAGGERVEVEVGRGPAASVLLGSVSQQCVEHGPCPTVVMGGVQMLSNGPILVGLDGSGSATPALEWAIDLATATGSEIVAVRAPQSRDGSKVLEVAAEALEQWCAPLWDREEAHEMRIEAGDARTALEHTADLTDASLLVVGTRDLGAVRGLLLGSVAGYIARYAIRPIAVVPGSTG